jgi:hypothetical protein
VPVSGDFAIDTLNSVGTIGVIEDGTVSISGTIAEITNIAGGTIVTTMGDLSGGTIDILTAGSIVVTNGTVASVGTIPGVGIVGNVNSGTIAEIGVINDGSVAITALPDLPGGTVDSLGTAVGVGVVGNVNAGSIVVTNGTVASVGTVPGVGVVASVTNLAGGTIGILTNGTVSTNILPLPGVVLASGIAIGTTATAMPASPLASRKSVTAYNAGSLTVYVGGSGVTTATGIPVGTGAFTPALDLGTGLFYGICAAASGSMNVMEVS